MTSTASHTERVKYPRTYHLPWSPGATSDDRMLANCDHFVGQDMVYTEKRDGENNSLYSDGFYHARSLDGHGHEWQSWVARAWRERAHHLPQNWRVVVENLYAKHSIGYSDLSSFFEVIAVYDDRNTCLSWDDTATWAALLDMPTVPVLSRGMWDEKAAKQLWVDLQRQRKGTIEGFVARRSQAFQYEEFSLSVAKLVRANHVTTGAHWTKSWTTNGLA